LARAAPQGIILPLRKPAETLDLSAITRQRARNPKGSGTMARDLLGRAGRSAGGTDINGNLQP